MLPDAPGLFSTTAGWPQLSVIFTAISRASTSVEPPGAHGTISRMTFDG